VCGLHQIDGMFPSIRYMRISSNTTMYWVVWYLLYVKHNYMFDDICIYLLVGFIRHKTGIKHLKKDGMFVYVAYFEVSVD